MKPQSLTGSPYAQPAKCPDLRHKQQQPRFRPEIRKLTHPTPIPEAGPRSQSQVAGVWKVWEAWGAGGNWRVCRALGLGTLWVGGPGIWGDWVYGALNTDKQTGLGSSRGLVGRWGCGGAWRSPVRP